MTIVDEEEEYRSVRRIPPGCLTSSRYILFENEEATLCTRMNIRGHNIKKARKGANGRPSLSTWAKMEHFSQMERNLTD